ncbi:hypothetical protein ScPMuIL_010578 [Solemya velum]
MQAWTKVDRSATTYDSHFDGRQVTERTKIRPNSPTRRNNPHPPTVFLTNRLHYVPGFHYADATMRKGPYQVDGSLPVEEKYQRRQLRDKFVPRPHSAAIEQYTDKYGLREVLSPVEAQGGKAWLTLADDKDHDKFDEFLEEYRRGTNDLNTDPLREIDQAVPSLHRWMKFSGNQEQSNIQQHTVRRPITAPPSRAQITPPVLQTLGDRKNQDIEGVKRVRYIHKPFKGDFLIHPEWPPTMIHHRLPGFPAHS